MTQESALWSLLKQVDAFWRHMSSLRSSSLHGCTTSQQAWQSGPWHSLPAQTTGSAIRRDDTDVVALGICIWLACRCNLQVSWALC